MLLNIEMKGPWCSDILAKYDVHQACSIVKSAIEKFKIGHRTIVSSFIQQINNQMLAIAPDRQFKIFSLMNGDGPEKDGYKPS